jgi:hypothetical protein
MSGPRCYGDAAHLDDDPGILESVEDVAVYQGAGCRMIWRAVRLGTGWARTCGFVGPGYDRGRQL